MDALVAGALVRRPARRRIGSISSAGVLTFRRGSVRTARFAPDGQTIIYSASWEGKPTEIYVSHPESPESRAFGVAATDVLAVFDCGTAMTNRDVNADPMLDMFDFTNPSFTSPPGAAMSIRVPKLL